MAKNNLFKKAQVFEKLAVMTRSTFLSSFAQEVSPKELNETGNNILALKNRLADYLKDNWTTLLKVDQLNNSSDLKAIYQNLKYMITGNDVKAFSDVNDQVKKLDAVLAPVPTTDKDINSFKINARQLALAVLQEYKKFYYLYQDYIEVVNQSRKSNKSEESQPLNLASPNLYSSLLNARDKNLSSEEISNLAKSVPQLKQRLNVIDAEIAEKQDSTNPYPDEQGLTDAQKVQQLIGEKKFITQILNKYNLA